MNATDGHAAAEAVAPCGGQFEDLFESQYPRIARIVARVIRDPARAEELAVEAFLKWRRAGAPVNAEAWLCTVAVRLALDELRAKARRERLHRLLPFLKNPTPEDTRAANEEQHRVRQVLRVLPRRQAQLLILRQEGLSYGDLALAVHVKPASVGTLLNRAQAAFRKEYVERYGEF